MPARAFAEAGSGIEHDFGRAATPAFAATSSDRAKKAGNILHDVDGGIGTVAVVHDDDGRMARRDQGGHAPLSRCRPQTSLAIVAPVSSAQATTSDFMLSIETGTPSATRSGAPDATASPLSSAETGCEPP